MVPSVSAQAHRPSYSRTSDLKNVHSILKMSFFLAHFEGLNELEKMAFSDCRGHFLNLRYDCSWVCPMVPFNTRYMRTNFLLSSYKYKYIPGFQRTGTGSSFSPTPLLLRVSVVPTAHCTATMFLTPRPVLPNTTTLTYAVRDIA